MKKGLSKKEKEKIEKYISLDEMNFLKGHYGEVPNTYWEWAEMWNKFLKYYFPDDPIDHKKLSFILLEMNRYYSHYFRLYNDKFEITPLINQGSTGLLDATEKFNSNFLNIESVRITVKNHRFLSEKDIITDIDELKYKDAVPKFYKIEGKEVLNELFKLINENKDIFEKLSTIELKYKKPGHPVIRKNKPRTYLRKRYSKILYQYLKDHLLNFSPNKLYNIGGFMLFVMEIMPDTKTDLTINKNFKDYIRNNFKKALFSKI